MAIDNVMLGQAIRTVRDARRLTQRQVADGLGKTITFLSLVENGHRGVSMETLNDLEHILKIPAACLILLGSKPSGKSVPFRGLMDAAREAILAAVDLDSDDDCRG